MMDEGQFLELTTRLDAIADTASAVFQVLEVVAVTTGLAGGFALAAIFIRACFQKGIIK